MRSAAASTMRAHTAAPRDVNTGPGLFSSQSSKYLLELGLTGPVALCNKWTEWSTSEVCKMALLQNGSKFPQFEIPAVGGGAIKLPQSLAGSFGVVLIYRGAWCPFCNAQLAAFERATRSSPGWASR